MVFLPGEAVLEDAISSHRVIIPSTENKEITE
jgi:hypothetical protein